MEACSLSASLEQFFLKIRISINCVYPGGVFTEKRLNQLSRLIDADGFLMAVPDKQMLKRLQTRGRIFRAVVRSAMFNGLSKNAA